MKNRITAVLLAALILVPALTACSDSADTADTTAADTAAVGETTAAEVAGETDRSQVKDNLPELDFGGQTVRFLHRDDDAECSMEVDTENTGDVVDEAVYERTVYLEERLNVKIAEIGITATVHDNSSLIKAVRQSVTAGSDDYDIMFNHMSGTTPLALEGMLIDLMTLDYLDFSQPWWAGDFINNATLYGRCYFAAGDAALTFIQSMYLMYYNKALYNSCHSGNPYDIVWDGGWTLDKMAELGRAAYIDVNGNSVSDYEDVFGFSMHTGNLVDAMLFGCDMQLSKLNSDGDPELYIDAN